MTAQAYGQTATGLLGPVSLSGALVLMVASPLMRGGNRHVALIALEFLAVFILAAMAAGIVRQVRKPVAFEPELIFLLASPLLIAVVQLVPLPAAWWNAFPGHHLLNEALAQADIAGRSWRPLSVSPAATAASLLAGLPIVAALIVGYCASIAQLRIVIGVVTTMALGESVLGLLQIAGGEFSAFYAGVLTYGAPIGTFANRNHFANYLGMALVGMIWLAYESHRDGRMKEGAGTFGTRNRTVLFTAGASLLALGILMSRSRGGAIFSLPIAACAAVAITARLVGPSAIRMAIPLLIVLLLGIVGLLGFGAATERLTGDQLASSASFRGLLTETTLRGAMAFLPFGSGWGTFDMAYPRFQPIELPGFANQAHMDYVQFLFEGGVLFLLAGSAFAMLVARRVRLLAVTAWQRGALHREAMAPAICGMGLLVLLLHSLVDFNMRIPANAILGALLAGVFLRPLDEQQVAA